MLGKKVTIVGGKTDQGFVMVDRDTGKGIKLQNEVVFTLTSLVWQLCGQMDPDEMTDKLAEQLNLRDEKQKQGLKALINDAIITFIQMGWAESKKKISK